MPRTEAAVRARSGQVTKSVVTIERPETVVKGPDGDICKLPPRASGGVPTLQNQKVNALAKDPATGKRRKRGSRARGPAALLQKAAAPALPQLQGMMHGRKGGISFSALAIGAFIGWRVFQVVRQRLRSKRQPPPQQQQLQQPHAPIVPALLRHVLPKLGPPSRVKRLAQQHHAKPRKAPNARQKTAPGTGVRQRRQGLLEKFDSAMKRQALVQAAQQAHSGATRQHLTGQDGALPLPSVQPMLLLAEADMPVQPVSSAEQLEAKPQQAMHRD